MSKAEQQARKEAREDKQLRQQELRGIENSMQEGIDEQKKEYVDSILESEAAGIESETGLDNWSSREFALSNIGERYADMENWRLELLYDKVVCSHPRPENPLKGAENMQFYYGVDPGDTPTDSLSPSQKQSIRSYLEAALFNIMRSKGMKQQEMFTKNITESIARRVGEDEEKGGLRGYLGR